MSIHCEFIGKSTVRGKIISKSKLDGSYAMAVLDKQSGEKMNEKGVKTVYNQKYDNYMVAIRLPYEKVYRLYQSYEFHIQIRQFTLGEYKECDVYAFDKRPCIVMDKVSEYDKEMPDLLNEIAEI